MPDRNHLRTALVLGGGGARGAYEVGILAYLEQELMPELGRDLPFDILTGTSIGALNACSLAAMADEPRVRAGRMMNIWRKLDCNAVLSFGFFDALRLFRESFGIHLGGGHRHDERKAGLVDTSALQRLLLEQIPWRRIRPNLQAGLFEALSIGATDVSSGRSTIFVQRRDVGFPMEIRDSSYVTIPARISARHALASAAIPLVFPPVRIGYRLYADGGLRLNVPLSPALRLGAERIVVVSLRTEDEITGGPSPETVPGSENVAAFPSFPFLLGKMLDAVLGESVEQDIDRLRRLNVILEAGEKAYGKAFAGTLNAALEPLGHLPLRQVRTMLIRPSRDLSVLAAEYMKTEFKPTKGTAGRLLSSIAERESDSDASLVSYLLFDGGFAERLMDLGRRDARARHDDWVRFWTEPTDAGTAPRPLTVTPAA